jgi:hypothetical protein
MSRGVKVADLVDRLRQRPPDLVARSAGLLDARGYLFVARLPEKGRPLHLVGHDPGRNRLVVVAVVAWGRRLAALLQLLGDRRLARLCRCPGVAEVQLHCWRRSAAGRLVCETLTLTAADFAGRARGPAGGRWGAAV